MSWCIITIIKMIIIAINVKQFWLPLIWRSETSVVWTDKYWRSVVVSSVCWCLVRIALWRFIFSIHSLVIWRWMFAVSGCGCQVETTIKILRNHVKPNLFLCVICTSGRSRHYRQEHHSIFFDPVGHKGLHRDHRKREKKHFCSFFIFVDFPWKYSFIMNSWFRGGMLVVVIRWPMSRKPHDGNYSCLVHQTAWKVRELEQAVRRKNCV